MITGTVTLRVPVPYFLIPYVPMYWAHHFAVMHFFNLSLDLQNDRNFVSNLDKILLVRPVGSQNHDLVREVSRIKEIDTFLVFTHSTAAM